MENTPYFESIVAHRALMLDPEEALAGETLVSLETSDEFGKDDLLTCIQDNLSQFLRGLRTLSASDQELLLSYYMLGKTQTTLAWLNRSTQTVCSSLIRLAMKRLAASLQEACAPEMLKKILSEAKLENLIEGLPLSDAVLLYEKTWSFQYVADKYEIHRPAIRRAMRLAATQLLESKDEKEQMIGAYVHGLINRASASGQGFSKRQADKHGNLYVKDPECLGQFRIDLNQPHTHTLFTARANR